MQRIFLGAVRVFALFSVLYMKDELRLDYVWAGLCLAGAAYFMFRGTPAGI